MELIPVIDLKGGVVVRARMGERRSYRPIETPLSPTCTAIDVVRGLRTLHPFETFYVADLDAIEGVGDNLSDLVHLASQFELTLWVDNGAADLAGARRCLDAGLCPVVGSETQRDPSLVASLATDARVALSLDFRDGTFAGPQHLLECPALWPQRVIVMTLDRVGSGRGPDTQRLAAIRDAAGGGRSVYAAGGVRDAGDLAQLADMGVAGVLVASALHDGRVTASDIAALCSPSSRSG
jgi:phosphoribosylformimino-5-aminoimidazole carboxamide ribotide isomerase